MVLVTYSFDTNKLKEHYNGSVSRAYKEFKEFFTNIGFEPLDETTLLSHNMNIPYIAFYLNTVKENAPWISKCIKDMRVMRISDYANVTKLMQN